MASSSSASNSQYCPPWKYKVFLSFRGVDTRNNFTSHLYKGLENRGIFTFLDDERLEDGDSISKELVQAIEKSQVAVIVFSKNYATSRWCLNELVKIMECKEKENGQTVIPVFYDVDPSHVRYQSESFAEAFAKHESRYKDDVGMQKVQGWRNALTAAADLKGHAIHDGIEMHDLIEDMGKNIVRMQKDSSRIWNVEDFEDVMMNNMRTMAVEAIWFTCSKKLSFSKEAMKNMQSLRILSIRCYPCDSIEYLPNNLCCFVWHCYPWKLLPENFNPRRLVHLDLQLNSLHYLWKETKLQQFLSLRRIDLSYSYSLKRTPDFKGIPNLEYLNLRSCKSLEEVHPSLKYCKKLMKLNLSFCTKLERFPYVNVESLESLNLKYCSSLEKFPEILGIREPPLSFFDLHLNGMKNLVSLPSSICKSKGLVKLSVSKCSKLESLPEEIGDLENLEELDARDTLISRPPSSIVWLNKLKSLSFGQPRSADGVFFVFPQVNKGLLSLKSLDLSYCNMIDGGLPKDIGSLSSLKHLNLSYCNIIDGGLPEDIGSLSSLEDLCLKGNNFEHLPRSIAQLCSLRFLDLTDCKRLTQLPEDIGCLSSLKELYLSGNNFEHLPQSISELGALRSLNLSDCKRLTQLPEFQQQLDIIDAVWSNASICNSLFQNISSLQHDICSSDSLSLRVFGSWVEDIPSWFNYQEMFPSVSVNLPENWYEPDKFLGFAVCYYGEYYIDCITAHLIPLCDDGMSSMTHDFALSNNLEVEAIDEINIYFFLIPLGGLWDASNANEKTPNDYGCIKLDVFGETDDDIGETDDDIGKTYDDFGETDDDFGKFGVRLLYKDEVELHFGIRKSR